MPFPSSSHGLHLQISQMFPNLFGPKSLHRVVTQTYCSPCTGFASAAICVHEKLWSVMSQLSFSPFPVQRGSFSAQSFLAWKGNSSPGWSWLIPHYHYSNTRTFHERTVNLIVWMESNKSSVSTASNKCHILLSALAHPKLQHFDSFLLPPLT